jgi:hypothetical protein
MYIANLSTFIEHCFIFRPSGSTVSEDAWIEPSMSAVSSFTFCLPVPALIFKLLRSPIIDSKETFLLGSESESESALYCFVTTFLFVLFYNDIEVT